MSPNTNYIKGRAFEYARMKHWREVMKCTVMRTAGSHGMADLIVITPKGQVIFIQCKVTKDPKEAKRLLAGFKKFPPLPLLQTRTFQQAMEVKVVGSTEVFDVYV